MDTRDFLLKAVQALRTPNGSGLCECEPQLLGSFDRTVCPEPCGSMHYFCVDCGRVQGTCPVARGSDFTSDYDIAVAEWLEDCAKGWAENFAATQRPSAGIDQPAGIHFGDVAGAKRSADHHARYALKVAEALSDRAS